MLALLNEDAEAESDQASACVGEMLAPLALSSSDGNIVNELLGKVASGHRGALDAISSIVDCAGDDAKNADPERVSLIVTRHEQRRSSRAREAKTKITRELASGAQTAQFE